MPLATGSLDGKLSSGDYTKIQGIETAATADQTDAEIKTAYENNADTNAYTDAEKVQYINDANNEYDAWVIGNQSIDTIAFEIYNNKLLEKKISKAVVAQVFAQILEETDLTLYDIRSDDKLKYFLAI